MINVSESMRNAYLSDRAIYRYRIEIPDLGLTFDNDDIVAESMRLSESLCDNDSIEFVGCISSMFQITLYDVQQNIKGQLIRAYARAEVNGYLLQDEIPLFYGFIENVEIESENYYKKITAYDAFHRAADINISDFYSNLTFPITLGEFRRRLCNYMGISFDDEETLPNDSVQIERQYEDENMNGYDCLRAIYQFNGACGIINRQGHLVGRYVSYAMDGLYPGQYTYPGAYTFPGAGSSGDSNNFALGFYEPPIKYQEYLVNPVDCVIIRNNEEEAGVSAGTGDNKYIIQANMYAYGLSDTVLEGAAQNILTRLASVVYHPFEATSNGLPFLEVGDTITYAINDDNRVGGYNVNTFLILSRTLTGTSFLRDTYSAKGLENQSLFITDLQTQIDTLKLTGGGGDMSDYYTKEETDTQIQTAIAEDVERFEPISFMPEPRANNLVYLVRGTYTNITSVNSNE